jgi:splicing factor U2AF subunit
VSALTPEQQKQLEALQQAEMQRQLQRQQVLLNNGAGGLNAAMAANKKQREVYVGNLVIGSVSDLMLRELFNAALAHFVSDPVTRPPVVSVTMDGSGRFGFVELRTEELAAEAMKLDKVNLGGREINVGRPKGYIEPPPGSKRDPNEVWESACCHCQFLVSPYPVVVATRN